MYRKPVKIVATLGPATHSPEKIVELAKAGVDVFRINFSHATADEAIERVEWVRSAEKVLKRPLAIMGDLPGPKIRISEMEPNTILEKGQTFVISKHITLGDKNGCGLNYSSIVDILEVGADVYIDDGTLKLVVTKKLEDKVETTVVVGGHIKPRKGFSAEGISLSEAGLSEKDMMAIQIAIDFHIDALAVSFVQSVQDMLAVKKLLPEKSHIMLIAKIETANGVINAERILDVADGLMVARGDLGLAVPLAKVPHMQKQLIDICVKRAKPVITATQMLESMISKPIPTRAEVGDVANAILDHTDSVMLSAETAEGKFPIETVEMMVKIINEAVHEVKVYEYPERNTAGNAISDEVGKIADQIGVKLVMAYTQTGDTARRISRHRHQEPIIAISPDPMVIRGLNFSWNVFPLLIQRTTGFENMIEQARDIAINNHVKPLQKDDLYIISAGMPFGESGTTNMILVQKV